MHPLLQPAEDQFLDNLQEATDKIPSNEAYVILGDFNARVGSRGKDDDQWEHVQGPHGWGTIIDAGRELLAFLSLNGATFCNTWFEMKNIKKQKWQHPSSKKWHCIDFAITRWRDLRRCLDAAVKRMAGNSYNHRAKSERTKGFDVSKLHDNNDGSARCRFEDQVLSGTKDVERRWHS